MVVLAFALPSGRYGRHHLDRCEVDGLRESQVMLMARIQIAVTVGNIVHTVGLEVAVVAVVVVIHGILHLCHPFLGEPASMMCLCRGGELFGGRGIGLSELR